MLRTKLGCAYALPSHHWAGSMSDEKHIELETKIAFLEQSINELSDVLYTQQQTLDALQQNMAQISGKLRDTAEQAEQPADSKPPHY
jgi:SlyX protein